jgi:hypothetical protein
MTLLEKMAQQRGKTVLLVSGISTEAHTVMRHPKIVSSLTADKEGHKSSSWQDSMLGRSFCALYPINLFLFLLASSNDHIGQTLS